jgi:acyl-CoA synthetase (NDP forming)/RimJ/RimL family protein N-acetyltransferase
MVSGADQHRSDPPGYPAHFEADVVLADGATAHVRPIRPEDGARILAFHDRQSPQSIYYRYFSPRPRLSAREVEQMTGVDYVDRMALVALRGDDLIGVARYDRWRHRSEAEVAFFVDDANHGRGLATLLLEHLAVRAREVGLTAFTASVLPENRKMITVFTQAGFQAATKFADGVIEVRLGITPTADAEAAIDARAHSAAAAAVQRLLSPRSVAVIGAGRSRGSLGHEVLRNLQRAGFEGSVYAVNPNADHVRSVRAVPSILDVHDEVDLAVVALPAAQVAAVVEECGRKQVYGVVVLSAGFSEAGAEGAALEAEVLRVARSWGIRVIGPNCLGVINTDPDVSLHATFVQLAPRRGRVSLLSESGMVGAAIVDQASELGIGISSFVALGNRVDVSGNDLLQYWEDDEHTGVVCMYIESFGNARHFSRLARRLSRTKPVVAVKAGWLPGGPAHVAERTGLDDVLLRQTGVLRVPTLSAMLDTTRLLVSQPLPLGRRVAVLGNAGGSLAIVADAVLAAGLALAEPHPATIGRLAERQPPSVGPSHPVDLGLEADGPAFEVATEVLAADPGVDAVLVVFAPSLGATAEEALAAVERGQQRRPDVPVVSCFYGRLPNETDAERRVPVYAAVDAAARALGHVAAYGAWLAREEGPPFVLWPDTSAKVRAVVVEALEQGQERLTHAQVARVLDGIGVPALPTGTAATLVEALAAADAVGYPIALKAAGRDVLAKTAAAGLALDLPDAGSLEAAWLRMAERFGEAMAPALVQPMVEPGVDVAVAIYDHPEVGPVVAIRPGGAHAALDQVADVRVLPIGSLEIGRLIAESRLSPFLEPESRDALGDALARLAALVEEVPEIRSIAINPMIVDGDRTTSIDVEIAIAPVEQEPLPNLRRV